MVGETDQASHTEIRTLPFAPVFLVSRFTGDPKIMEPHKHDGLAWFPLDAIPDALTRSTIVALAALQEAGAGHANAQDSPVD